VRVTFISSRQRKRRSIFATDERGNVKIELLSPHCITTLPQWSLPETLLASEADVAWSDESPPPAHDSTVGRRPSSCALPWVGGILDPVSPLLLRAMT
jgi:hypothetical protein